MRDITGIRQVEKLIMTSIRWTEEPLLVPLSVEVVESDQAECRELLAKASKRVELYAAQFEVHREVVNLDVEAYVAEIMDNPDTSPKIIQVPE